MRKAFLVLVFAIGLAASAQALPVTSFTTTPDGGFVAYVYPTLADGTFSYQSPIITLPISVNAGYVVILDNLALDPKDTSNWSDVIRFIDNGTGKATTMQMFVGGPDQASYFPSFNKVNNASHVFIAETSDTGGSSTQFTEYSVSGNKTREYHFFTAAIPETGATVALLGLALAFVFALHRKLSKA
ncbi:MAG: hypothetical protein JWO45_882 [Spartobacteria bacterium]|nr:hypothetical protein [Spartobacteria bacterium]